MIFLLNKQFERSEGREERRSVTHRRLTLNSIAFRAHPIGAGSLKRFKNGAATASKANQLHQRRGGMLRTGGLSVEREKPWRRATNGRSSGWSGSVLKTSQPGAASRPGVGAKGKIEVVESQPNAQKGKTTHAISDKQSPD
jgi:hypothetical protein